MPSLALDGSRIRRTIFFAEQCRTRVDTKIDRAIFRQAHFDAAILRHAAFRDIHARHYFQSGTDFIGQYDRWLRDFGQNAVEAGSYAKDFLVGLEVNIGCTAFDRVQQDFVNEADNGRIFYVVAFYFLDRIRRRQSRDSRDRNRHRRDPTYSCRQPRWRCNPFFEFVLFYDDRVDAQAGGEFDVVYRLQVGRIGYP